MAEEKKNEVATTTQGGTAVIKKDRTIAGMLASPETSWGRELSKILPSSKDVARFMACALAQLADPKVGAKLSHCTLPSFYNAILKAGRSGIMPDGVNAFLIPYGSECTLQFSYRGLCDMAIRKGIALKFSADVVRKNDVFRWSDGELKEHTILSWDEEERGDIVGVWVRAYLPDSDGKFNPELHADCRMSIRECEKIRSKSQNKNGVWAEWFEEMMKKSCLKRLFKTMQNTPEIAELINEDNKEFVLDGHSFDRSSRVTPNDILAKRKSEPEETAANDAEVIDAEVSE